MFRNTFLSMVLGSALFVTTGTVAQAATFQVNYRNETTSPWQFYKIVNNQAAADQVVTGLQESGLQTQVIPVATPGTVSFVQTAPVVRTGFVGSYYNNPGYTWGGYGWNGGHGWHGGHHWNHHHGVHHNGHHGAHHAHAHHAHHGGHHGGHHR